MSGPTTIAHHLALPERIRALEAEKQGLYASLMAQGTKLDGEIEAREKSEAELAAALESDMLPFFREMTRKFRSHIPDRGDSWKRTDWDARKALMNELVEASEEDALAEEWADVANYAFFLWWRAAGREGRPKG